jgi:tRNA dimethylallyltransferase
MSKNKFVVITGPTAAGKTKVSVQVAKQLSTQIISADSMQIYRGMDIGTAKATAEEMDGVVHHMIDIVLPDETFTVVDFQQSAFSLIDRINENGRIPIIAGGTGLYVNALVYQLDFGNTACNHGVREKYNQLANDKSVQYIYNILIKEDPAYASKISSQDQRRIVRRLEILESGETSAYDFRRPNDQFDILIIGLKMPREALYQRINERVDEMMSRGLVEEVRRVYDKYGYVHALKGIGYKELIAHFEGEYDIEEAVRLIKRNTRRFAKRQMTWFRSDPRIKWFDISEYSRIEEAIYDIINHIKGKGF